MKGAQAIQVQHASNSKLNHQELFTCPKPSWEPSLSA
jgi:hypothetical protein